MSATDTANHKFFEAKPRLTGKVGAGGVASDSATTIPHTFVGLDEGDAYIVTVNRTDSTGTIKNPASQTETFIGKVSGGNFINCVRELEGTAQAWAADTVLEILNTATGINKMIEGIEAEHNQDGTHKESALDSMIAGAEAQGDIIYHNGTIWTRLAKGTAKQLLRMNAGATVPEWVTQSTETETLENKRITKRVVTAADGTSITPNSDTSDVVKQVNTQSAGTLTINAPTGTPTDGQPLILAIKSTNAQTYSFNAAYKAGTLALPTGHGGSSKWDYLGFIYNSTDSNWKFVGQSQAIA
jgi:hypothetical protein